MGAFKKLGQTDLLTLKQRGGVIVFLESQDDFEIIAQRWFFDEGADLYFQPADSFGHGSGGGGCLAVIDLVTGTRADGVRAVGLVDRDALLSGQDWAHWWETDDDLFANARPFGDHVRVLSRWEIENYLLDPAAMATVANDLGMTSQHTPASIAEACLRWADDLKYRTAAGVVAVQHGQKNLSEGFGCNPLVDGTDLVEKLQGHLRGLNIDQCGDRLQEAKRRIDRFDVPAVDAIQRWERILRMIDGKAALKYLSRQMGPKFDQQRGTLARRLREEGRIPPEIRRHIEGFKGFIADGAGE